MNRAVADTDLAAAGSSDARLAINELRRVARTALLVTHLLLGALLACALPLLFRLRRARAADGVIAWWVRRLLEVLHIKLNVVGRPATGAVLYVSNHISWLDIPVLRAIVQMSFVSKADVLNWPIIGRMAERAGTIFLSRGAGDTNGTADVMTFSLQQQRAVSIFPEGTTTTGNEVRRFHARLYQAAIRTRSLVQAVAIRYPNSVCAPFVDDQELVPHLWRLLGEPDVEATLVFCDPTSAGGTPRRALAEHTRAQIQQALGLAELNTERNAAVGG